MYRDIATTLYKRGAASMDGYQMPSWAPAVLLLNFVIFLPFTLIVSYTFQHVYPTLAMVEDPSPPAYAPVSLDDEVDAASSGPSVITSSLRRTHRVVYAAGGWRSLLRGFSVYLFWNVAKGFVALIFMGVGVPAFIAAVLVPFVLVQPFATWTHTIISANRSSKSFWKRFPPFKKTFEATALPLLLYMVAKEMSAALPLLLSSLLGMNIWNPTEPNTLPKVEKDDAWKGLLVLISALALHIFLVVPAQVVLTRVQASFLPEEEDTLVPFDRTFGGKVEPAIVSGKGYVSMADAWKSFSRASWLRLIKLYVKIFVISLAVSLVWSAVVITEYIIIANSSRKVSDL